MDVQSNSWTPSQSGQTCHLVLPVPCYMDMRVAGNRPDSPRSVLARCLSSSRHNTEPCSCSLSHYRYPVCISTLHLYCVLHNSNKQNDIKLLTQTKNHLKSKWRSRLVFSTIFDWSNSISLITSTRTVTDCCILGLRGNYGSLWTKKLGGCRHQRAGFHTWTPLQQVLWYPSAQSHKGTLCMWPPRHWPLIVETWHSEAAIMHAEVYLHTSIKQTLTVLRTILLPHN